MIGSAVDWAVPLNTFLLVVLAVTNYGITKRTEKKVDRSRVVAKEAHNALVDVVAADKPDPHTRKFDLSKEVAADDVTLEENGDSPE